MSPRTPTPAPDPHEQLRRFKAEVFQVLAHPTRIHVIECLRNEELSVGALQERIGVEPANLSQHLAVLRSRRLVIARREGNQVFYSLSDPLLTAVLEAMKRYFHAHVAEWHEALAGMRELQAQEEHR